MPHTPRPPKGSTLDLARRAQKRHSQKTSSSSGIAFHKNPHQEIIMHTEYSSGSADRPSDNSTYDIAVPTSRPVKRSRKAIADPASVLSPQTVPSTRNQGASVDVNAFSLHFKSLLQGILEHERPRDPARKCRCGAAAKFQCENCTLAPFSCKLCVLEAHRHTHYHWINEWNGKFFVRRDLSWLGLTLNLEHEEDICPHMPPAYEPKKFTVVDLSGIHQVFIYYCHCAQRPSQIRQLLRAQLFPATVEHPAKISTAFTFSVLSDFHIQNLTLKKSAYDYCKGLRHLTNNAFPSLVSNKYRAFLLVSRVWRHLVSLKRSGQAHGIDSILTQRVPGSTAVRCVACPEEGFNMQNGWKETPQALRHLHTKYLSADGNHGNQKKFKRDDPDDLALGNGRGYFPEDRKFKEYLKAVSETQEKSTCANLKAVNMQNKAKFRNLEVTGVVAIVCARHGIFQPGAVVDLQKGEQYVHVDYALVQALRESTTLPWITVTYDVACQWSVNLVKRFERYFPDYVEVAKRISVYVAKMHAQGHKEDCRYRFSLNYSDGVGRTSGELIETVWHEHNQAGGSTKEMNAGHHHDMLDDLFGDWNWLKVQEMSSSLRYSLINARAMYTKSKMAFDCLDVSPEQVNEWVKLPTEPFLKDGEWHSVYRANTTKAPSQARVYQQLYRQESQMNAYGISSNGEVQFLNTGIRLQAEQRHLQDQISVGNESPTPEAAAESISKARARLRCDIEEWRKFQLTHFPTLGPLILESAYQNPEEENLHMPSDFPPLRRGELGLEALAIKERQLREGEANDALEKVRTAIKQFGINVSFKMKVIRGQRDSTRAQKILKDNVAARNKHVRKYRLAHDALIRLGMPEDDPTYRVLTDEDLWMKNILLVHELGDGTRDEPWIWRMNLSTGNSAMERATWEQEVDRVRWFRARANRDRWYEEVSILEEEFRHTFRSFTRMAEVWTQLAVTHGQPNAHIGFQEYAYKQAKMYDKFAEMCNEHSNLANGVKSVVQAED